jgi:DNA-binding transcriptional MerR regulator
MSEVFDTVSEINMRNGHFKKGCRPPKFNKNYAHDDYAHKKKLILKLSKLGFSDKEIKKRLGL